MPQLLKARRGVQPLLNLLIPVKITQHVSGVQHQTACLSNTSSVVGVAIGTIPQPSHDRCFDWEGPPELVVGKTLATSSLAQPPRV